MQQANEILTQILHVVASIDQTMKSGSSNSSAGGPGATGGPSIFKGIGSSLKQMFSVNYKGSKSFLSFSQKLLDITEKTPDKNFNKLKILSSSFDGLAISLPRLSKGLEDFTKLKEKRVAAAVRNLTNLYQFLENAGDSRKHRKIERSIKTFEKLGDSLTKIAKPIRTISMALINISLGILAFAGTIILAGKLLGLGSAKDVFKFIIVAILGVAMTFGVLALGKNLVKRGNDTVRGIGRGMMSLAIGIVSFALAIRVVPKILGTGGNALNGILIVSGMILLMSLLFAGIGLLSKYIGKGVAVAAGMGLGMMFLAAGVLVFSLAAKAMGKFGSKGEAVNKKGEKRGKFGQMFAEIGPGLGMMGIIIVGAAIAFAAMGALSQFILPGIGVAIGMSLAMIILSKAVKKLVETGNELGTKEEIKESIGKTIGGTLSGFLDGIKVLAQGKKGGNAIKAFIKNSAVIFAGTAILLATALALSQFAKALTAFAELQNMRVIEGYDKDGKPKFGEKINIKNVSDNITYSISTFLKAIIDSTEGLQKGQARRIRRMARTLTGRGGILTAVIEFSNVLKTYAQFGPEGKIGFVDMVPDGTDEDGNAKFKQVASSVLITDVVSNIIDSFGKFVTEITAHTDEFTIKGKHGRRMRHLAEALLGSKGWGGKEKYGLLQPVTQFAETLQIYSKFGANNTIPVLDENGNIVDTVPVETIAKNIISSLSAFTKAMGDKKIKADTKQAEKNLKQFDDIIKQTNKIANSVDGLAKLSETLGNLAQNIMTLSSSLADLDVTKFKEISAASAAYLIRTGGYSRSVQTISEPPSSSTSNAGTPVAGKSSGDVDWDVVSARIGDAVGAKISKTKSSSIDWDVVSAQIGDAVGTQIISAMKSGQLKFEFSGGPREGIMEFS